MNIRDLMDWCEEQNQADSTDAFLEILEAHPAMVGQSILLLLWRAATHDRSDLPNQSEENVETFYRKFPSLPIMRPLLKCTMVGCKMPTFSWLELIKHLAQDHACTAFQVAHEIRTIRGSNPA